MKRVLAVVSISILFTGCAQLENNLRRNLMDSVDVAREDCGRMGFIANSPQYQKCVMINTQNIRNVRAIRAAAADQEHAAFMNNLQQQTQPRSPVNQGYRNYECQARIGGRVECSGY